MGLSGFLGDWDRNSSDSGYWVKSEQRQEYLFLGIHFGFFPSILGVKVSGEKRHCAFRWYDKWKDGKDTLRFSLLAFNVKMTWRNRRENPPWEIRETHPRKKKPRTYVKDKLVEVWERYSRPWTIPFLANHYLLIRESTASILMMTEMLVRGWKGDNFRLSSHRAILRMGRKADTVMIRRRKVKSMFLSLLAANFVFIGKASRFKWCGIGINESSLRGHFYA